MRNWIDLFETAQPLPSKGQTPWWVEALAPLTQQMTAEWEDSGWSWTTGGCFAFAEALHAAYGGELWSFCSYAEDMDDYDVQHGVVKINDTFYDYNGVFDPKAYKKALAKEGMFTAKTPCKMLPSDSDEGYYWMQDDFFDDDGIATLTAIMKGQHA